MSKKFSFVTRPMAAAVAFALLGVTLGSIPAQAQVTLDFFEDFSGTAPDFTFVPAAGAWSVGGGVLTGDTGLGISNLDSAAVQITDDLSSTDIVVSTTLRATMLGGFSDAGFAAFGDDETFDFTTGVGHYLADFKASGSFRILRIATGGGITTIAASSPTLFTFDTSETYTLTLEATYSGSDLNLTFTIDDPSESGPISISGTDTSPLTGQYFGPRVRTGGGEGGTGRQVVTEYDNFSISVAPFDPGDFDKDGDIDGADFLQWQRGESDNPLSPSDLADWEAGFGTGGAPLAASVGTVPEPSTFLLMLGGLVCGSLLPRRGRRGAGNPRC